MFPNLTSFTSIYARMSRYYSRRLAGIRLVHVQQLEVEKILCEGKMTAENLSRSVDLPYTPQFDYRFEEEASIEFAQSHEAIGVQLADIVASTVMRYFRDTDAGTPVSSELPEAMMRLIDEGDGRWAKRLWPQSSSSYSQRPTCRMSDSTQVSSTSPAHPRAADT
nr:DUF3800 domain-containing protein [Pseudomonas syringae]